MKVKINGKEIELHYSFRIFIIYENITGENVDYSNFQSIKQLTTLFCSCIIASAQKDKIELDLTYDKFMDFLDENGGYQMLNEFTIWFASQVEMNTKLLDKEEEEQDATKELIAKSKKKVKR